MMMTVPVKNGIILAGFDELTKRRLPDAVYKDSRLLDMLMGVYLRIY
jgi:hypothetical protein